MESRIDFICADAYHVLSSFIPQHPCEEKGSETNSTEKNPPPKVDVVILAPPWGGPDYNVSKHFDMRTGFPSGDGLELIKLALRVSENVICIFPKNLSKAQLKKFADDGKILEAERIKRRTQYDLALIREVGYCNGIENYSRHFDGRAPGDH